MDNTITFLSTLKKIWHYTNFITNNKARKSVPVDNQNLDFVMLTCGVFLEGIGDVGKKRVARDVEGDVNNAKSLMNNFFKK